MCHIHTHGDSIKTLTLIQCPYVPEAGKPLDFWVFFRVSLLKAGYYWARFPYAAAAAVFKTDTPILNR